MKTIKYEMSQDQESMIIRALWSLTRNDRISNEDLKFAENLAFEMYQHTTGQDAVAVHQLYKLEEK